MTSLTLEKAKEILEDHKDPNNCHPVGCPDCRDAKLYIEVWNARGAKDAEIAERKKLNHAGYAGDFDCGANTAAWEIENEIRKLDVTA